MPTPMRPWTLRVLALIDEGVTDREALIVGAMPCVPLGHAYRVREWRRLNANARRRRRYPDALSGPSRPKATAGEAHRVGARQVLSNTLDNLCRTGHLIREGDSYRRVESVSATRCADEAGS